MKSRSGRGLMRWWLYVDMDAFYAEVERRDHPQWRRRAVIVGGSPAGPTRGVVASATYEARKYGVKAGLPMFYARRLCPDAVFVRPRFAAYTAASRQLTAILKTHSPEVYQASIDEAFIDLSFVHRGRAHPRDLAEAIREAIRVQLGLPSTMGLARTRLTAKVAGRCAKPRGFFWVPHGREAAFLASLPVGLLPGVGHRTQAKLGAMNIWTVAQLQACPPDRLRSAFGGRWWVFPLMARGEDPPRVTPKTAWPKSMGREVTLPFTTADQRTLWGVLQWLVEEVTWRMRSVRLVAESVDVRWRYADMHTVGWSDRLPWPTNQASDIYPWLRGRLQGHVEVPPPVRLLGVTFRGLSPRPVPPILLPDLRRHSERMRKVQAAVDRLRRRYGFFQVLHGDMARWLLNRPDFLPELSPLAEWMIRNKCDDVDRDRAETAWFRPPGRHLE